MMPSSFLPPSIDDRVQVPPLHWSSPPEASTAAQNVVVGHDTPVSGVGPVVAESGTGSMCAAADHACPFHWRASPAWSTAVQNVATGHDTPVKLAVPEWGSGTDHACPFHCEMPPETDMQNEEETQEIAETDPQSPLVPVHDPPSEAKASPDASTAAQYPVGAQPIASSPSAPSTVTGADQTSPFQPVTWSAAVTTAEQSDGPAHDAEMAPKPSGCAVGGTGTDHAVPSKE